MPVLRRYMNLGLYLLIIAVSISIYIWVSPAIGLYVGAGLIAITIILILWNTPRFMPYIRYGKLCWTLKKYPLVHEAQLQKIFKISNNRLHRQLYHVAKSWNFSPLVLLVKENYLFLNSTVISKLLPLIKKMDETEEFSRQMLVKQIRKKLKLKTRVEAEAIVQHLEKNMKNTKNS